MPGSKKKLTSFCVYRNIASILDLLEPTREDPAALAEAHEVLSLPFSLFRCGGRAHAWDRYDDEIFEHTLREFPEFAAAPHTSLSKLDEDWMKSKEGKERWREFINAYVLFPRAIHTTPGFLIAQLTYLSSRQI